jgi:hypothetical protein
MMDTEKERPMKVVVPISHGEISWAPSVGDHPPYNLLISYRIEFEPDGSGFIEILAEPGAIRTNSDGWMCLRLPAELFSEKITGS